LPEKLHDFRQGNSKAIPSGGAASGVLEIQFHYCGTFCLQNDFNEFAYKAANCPVSGWIRFLPHPTAEMRESSAYPGVS
jgi:hypothetical protein